MDQGDPTTYRTRVNGIIESTENTYHITFVSALKGCVTCQFDLTFGHVETKE